MRYTLVMVAILAPAVHAQGSDHCAAATPVVGFGTFAFDNTFATGGGLADCNGVAIRKDVWFRWTAPVSGSMRFETCATTTTFDTRIAVYDGVNCGAPSQLGCAAGTCLGLSHMIFSAQAGDTYLLRVGSRQVGVGGPGQFRLTMDECEPHLDDVREDNDTCDMATGLALGQHVGFWVSKDDPDWFSACVPAGEMLSVYFSVDESEGDIDVYAYADCDLTSPIDVSATFVDDELIEVHNTSSEPLNVTMRVELDSTDEVHHCNEYSFSVAGTAGNCGGFIGTNYCMANPNSLGEVASMHALGSEVVSDNAVELHATSLPPFSFAFFLTSLDEGFVVNPGGSAGNLCLGGPIGRFVGPGQIQQAGLDGSVQLPLVLFLIPQPNGTVSVAPGQSWKYQLWYRDTVGGTAGSNFTDGLVIEYR